MEQTRAKLLPHSGVAYKIVATDSVGHYSVPSVLVSGKTLDDDTPPAIKADLQRSRYSIDRNWKNKSQLLKVMPMY